MFYSLVRPFLFALDPELTHDYSLKGLVLWHKLLGKRLQTVPDSPREVMGLNFPNIVGLAAGLDKDGDYIDALAALGFGHIEIGTVTPKPQVGSPRPRLFRLVRANAIINRMGFNNKGVDHLVEKVKKAKFNGIIGINIGKNFKTPLEKAVDDYLLCLRRVYPYASYITINISSPNTPGLRELQYTAYLTDLLSQLKDAQAMLTNEQQRYVPLAVKISPDLTDQNIETIAKTLIEYKLDAVIATNTTIVRESVEHLDHGKEAGGLSGRPLCPLATRVVEQLNQHLQGKIPIIAVGGIMTADDVEAKIDAGATLVQVYTGLVYRGPRLIREICQREYPAP